MSIAIIGLGKLGYPMAEFLSSTGEEIRCYDSDQSLVTRLKKNENPLEYENQLLDFINNGNKLNFFYDIDECLQNSELVFITVPTLSKEDGSFDNEIILDVFNNIHKYILKTNSKLTIVINSTVSPGSIDEVLIPHLEKGGLKNNNDFNILYNPYFVALGDVLKGLSNPDFVLIGSDNNEAKNKLIKIYSKVYKKNIFSVLNFKEAELVKLLVNSFLTLKISFTNLVKEITKGKEVSTSKILKSISLDTRIAPKYLSPGGPFSGPCLPRDNAALLSYCKKIKSKNFLSTSINETNNNCINNLIQDLKVIKHKGYKSISFAGVGYKPNTNGLDESYVFKMLDYCVDLDFDIKIYDSYVKTIELKNNFKFERYSSLKDLVHKSEIVFLPYIDSKFNQLSIVKRNFLIWDIWDQVRSSKTFSKISELDEIEKNNHNLNKVFLIK